MKFSLENGWLRYGKIIGLVFAFHHPIQFLIYNTFDFLQFSVFFHPWQELPSDLPVYISAYELFYLIFSLCPLEEWGERAAGWSVKST